MRMDRFKEQRAKKTILKSIIPGEHLKLREDVLRHVHPRKWIFNRMDSGDRIQLLHESGRFAWSVKIENIDWEAYEKESGKKLTSQN